MDEEEEVYEIEIYNKGAYFKAPCWGKDWYLKEKEFLNKLTDRHYKSIRPIPDPEGDLYLLDDDQLEAYSKFRKQFVKP